MTNSRKHAALLVLAWASLGTSVLGLLALAERLFSAGWQWYKFSGYETPGVITLSIRTAWWFVGLIGGLILVSLVICKLEAGSTGSAPTIARFSFWISTTALALFALLGFSGLNHWRP